MPSSVRFALIAALLAAASPARAEEREGTVRLEWTSSDGCVGVDKLRTQVEEALGRNAFSNDDGADLSLKGRAGRGDDGYEAVVTLSRSSSEVLGTRTLRSSAARCDELSAGLPLALALMIDLPLREASVRVSLPPPPEPPREKRALQPEPPPPAVVAPPPPAPASGALAAGPVLRMGGVPRLSFGARVQGEAKIGPVPFGASFTWLAPQVIENAQVAARAWTASGDAYFCPLETGASRAQVGVCGVFELGGTSADGVRVVGARSDLAWFLSTGARMRAALAFAPPWTLGLDVGGSFYLVRPSVTYDVANGGTATLDQAWPGFVEFISSIKVQSR